MKKITLGTRKRLVEKLLLVEGMSRSGKFLLSNILNGFNDVEPVQYSGLLEHIPFMQKFGLIDKVAAEELIHHDVDLRAYELLIGRTLNHRATDKSSIFNVAGSARYLKRGDVVDPDKELKRFYERGAYSLFLIHETLPEIGIFFDTFPKMKMLYITRSPLDLAYEWFTRYDLSAWATDPTMFAIPAQGKKEMMPWYVSGRAKEYESLNHADRVILCMEVLFSTYETAWEAFPLRIKKNSLLVRYEDILSTPAPVIARIQKFLWKLPHREMKNILEREKLPNPGFVEDGKEKKRDVLKRAATAPYFEKLMALEESYNTHK